MPSHDHYNDDDEVIGQGDDEGKCSWCEDPICKKCRAIGKQRLCLGCKADGVMACAICKQLFIPHTEAEERAAGDYGTCMNCAHLVDSAE